MMSVQELVVVGQGYVGLPVAMRAAEVGFHVVGIDTDARRVAELIAGRSYVEDVPSLQLRQMLEKNRYRCSTSYEEAAGFDFAIITVPTPLNETVPDLSFIESAAEALAPHIKVGATVILESTTYPGTTEELFVPLLEKHSVLVPGIDFYVGYSPERIDPGNGTFGFVETPKVVSGISPESLARIEHLYCQLGVKTVSVNTPREAELTKLLENTFRHVNIALVNEFAIHARELGIDIWEVIKAASTKPFGFMPFTPGPGVGGHCLPIDPSYLAFQVRRKLGQPFRFIELANEINDQMPREVVRRVAELLNTRSLAIKGTDILLLGLSYKRNSGDLRESPGMKVAELLRAQGANLSAVDPLVEEYRWPASVCRVELQHDVIQNADLVVVVTDHDAFDFELVMDNATMIFDTRHRLSGPSIHHL